MVELALETVVAGAANVVELAVSADDATNN